MNHRAAKAVLVVFSAGLWMSCSSSTAAKPTVAGTWHIRVASMARGTVTPDSFDVTVTPSADTFIVSMPTVTWQVAPMPPVTFGSKAGVLFSSDTTQWGVWKGVTSGATVCGAFTVGGTLDASKNALSGVTVTAGDSMGFSACVPQTTGTGTATK